MRIRTLPAGNREQNACASAGFTLFEVLAVMVVIALTAAAISTLYRSPSGAAQVKTAALLAASRLRDLRSSAMTSGIERIAAIDVAQRKIEFSDGLAPIAFSRSMNVEVTAADSEKRSPSIAGIRFYPNGSSTGATIDLKMEGRIYEIRVNWLTGRVSTASVN
jgi:general secretion pathway protein H